VRITSTVFVHEVPRLSMLRNTFRITFLEFPIYQCLGIKWGASGSVVVKALCYEPESRGFETR
jgi:H+/Cl- antiporter ClcA